MSVLPLEEMTPMLLGLPIHELKVDQFVDELLIDVFPLFLQIDDQ